MNKIKTFVIVSIYLSFVFSNAEAGELQTVKKFCGTGYSNYCDCNFFSLYDVEIDELYCKDFNQFQELRSRNLKIIVFCLNIINASYSLND